MRRVITASLVLVFMIITAVHAQFPRSTAIAFRVNSISETKDGPNVAGRSFKRGQKIWFNVHVSGLVKDKQNNFDLEIDYTVSSVDRHKQGKEKVVNKKIPSKNKNHYDLHFSIQTTEKSRTGKYSIEIEVKDRVAGRYNVHHITFHVR